MPQGKLIGQFFSSRLTVTGAALAAFLLIVTIIGPTLVSYDPVALDLAARLQPPGARHWFGTDEVGRDLFTRVLYGGRLSLGIAFAVVGCGLTIGAIVGGASGLSRGWFDEIVMRVTEIVMALPPLVLAIALSAALGPSLTNLMLALIVVRIPRYIRLARAEALRLREADFVRAGALFGAGPWTQLRWHIFRNSASPLIVAATHDLGQVILSAAGLSFIGLGAQPPTAEWGVLVASGRSYLLTHWWYSILPGLAILLTGFAFNLLGDGVRDLLDPRQ